MVLKRTAHLTVQVSERPEKIAPVAAGSTGKPARKTRAKKAKE